MNRVRIGGFLKLATLCLALLAAFPAAMMLCPGAGGALSGNLAITTPTQTRADTDLGVVNVTFHTQYGPPFYPGMDIVIEIVIQNMAVEPADNYTVICSVNDQFSNTTVQYNSTPTALGPHGLGKDTVAVLFNWTPPLIPPPEYSYPHVFKVVCTISKSGDENASNNQLLKDLEIVKADFNPVLQLGLYTGSGEVDPSGYDPVHADVGETLVVPFVLFNEGQGNDTVQIACVKKPVNWTVSGFAPMDLKDGENTTDSLKLLVQVSKWKHDALEAEDYVITLQAYSVYYPLQLSSIDIHFSINFQGGLVVNASASELWGAPGTYQDFGVNITNTANGKDSFFSQVEPLDEAYVSQGWSAYIESGSLSPSISIGSVFHVGVRVYIPSSAQKGDHITVRLMTASNRAASTEDPVEGNVSVEVHTSTVNKPVLEALSPEYTLDPSAGTNKIYFNLTNNGNGKDDTIWLNVSSVPGGWTVALNTSDIPAGGLAHQATAVIGMYIGVPLYETPGTYEIKVEAWAGDPPVLYDVLSLDLLVVNTYKVALHMADTGPENVDPTSTLVYELVVRNLGNTEDIYDVAVAFTSGSELEIFRFSPATVTVTVPPNWYTQVNFTLEVPSFAPADTNLATPDVYEGYSFRFTARSLAREDVTAEKTLSFNVIPTYDLEVRADNDTLLVSGDADSIRVINLNVTNTGNIKDTIDFSVVSDYNWFTLPILHKFIPSREARNAVLQLEPRKGTAPGKYTFDIVATSRGDRSVVRVRTVTVTVVQFNFKVGEVKVGIVEEGTYSRNGGGYWPQAELDKGSDGKYHITTRETLMVQAEVLNIGHDYIAAYYGDVTVTFYDGQIPINRFTTNISMLNAGTPIPVSMLWNTSVAEEHSLRVVIDAKGNIPESSEDDNSAMVLLSVSGYTMDDDEGDEHPLEEFGGLGIVALFLVVMIVMAGAVFMVYVVRRRREEEARKDTEDRVASSQMYVTGFGGVELEEEEVEVMEYVSTDPQEDLEEYFEDPNVQPVFDDDPEGVLAEISDLVAGDEKPTDFELADDGLAERLAEKRDKGEISEDLYLQLLYELKD